MKRRRRKRKLRRREMRRRAREIRRAESERVFSGTAEEWALSSMDTEEPIPGDPNSRGISRVNSYRSRDGMSDGMDGGTVTGNAVRYEERDMCFEQDYSDFVEDGDGIDDIENAVDPDGDAMDDMYDLDGGPGMDGNHTMTGGDVEIIDLGMAASHEADRLILDRVNTSDLL